jgi:hypothetical protein
MTGQRPTGRRWSSDEINELQAMPDAGKIAPEIALKLNRTPQAIYAQLQRQYRKRRSGKSVMVHDGR